MTDYTALQAKWSTLSPGTTQAKLDQVNALTVAAAQPAILQVDKVINAISPADFTSLTSLQLQQMMLLLGGNSTVDASPGTTIRSVFQSIFSGKATTLANLSALVSPFDNAVTPWWKANGYGRAFDLGDIAAAGLS